MSKVKSDVAVVVKGLRGRYGSNLRWPLTELAAHLLGHLAEEGRIGDGPEHGDDWEPDIRDIEEFGGGLANSVGVMRLWRAEEIGYYALTALGRAGRLMDRLPAEPAEENTDDTH